MTDWQVTFVRLRQEFARALPSRVERLRQALAAVPDGGGAGDELRVLHREVHSLAGAAGSYGFGEVTASCHEAERVCKDLLDAPATLAARRAELDGVLDRLARQTRDGSLTET